LLTFCVLGGIDIFIAVWLSCALSSNQQIRKDAKIWPPFWLAPGLWSRCPTKDSSSSVSRDALAKKLSSLFFSIFFNLHNALVFSPPISSSFVDLQSFYFEPSFKSITFLHAVSQNLAFVDHRSALGKVRCGPLCSSRPICLTALEILGRGGLGLLGWIREPLTPSDDVPSVDYFHIFVCCLIPGDQAKDGLVLY
jgi:hypothetical protein